MSVTGGPPSFGGGMPQGIIVSSRSAPTLRTTGAGSPGSRTRAFKQSLSPATMKGIAEILANQSGPAPGSESLDRAAATPLSTAELRAL
jgi:hypothetical protein